MTAQNDLDRTLGAWFDMEAVSAPPPEPLARIIETTRGRRPRPTPVAGFGSQWVNNSTSGVLGAMTTLRPGLVIGLVALLVLALVGGAVLVGSRLLNPPIPMGHVYLNELVEAPDLSMVMTHSVLVPLVDGRVLVIGAGSDGGGRPTTALLYDPATGASVTAGPMESADQYFVGVISAVRLKDGRVLVIGDGVTQIFDPTTLRFAPVGPMVTPRRWAGVALLHDGRVLITGGYPVGGDAAVSSAELFDPDTLSFSPTGSMGTSRSMPSMAVLPDGRVFVSPGESRTTVEIYDPGTRTFSAAGTVSSYGYGDAIALPDGRVVVIGGSSLGRQGFAEVWDPTSLTFSPRRDLPGRVTSATLLDDGRIFLIGERDGQWSGTYDPATGLTPAQTPRAWWPSATRLHDGRVLIVGGTIDGSTPGGVSAPAVPTVQIFR